MAGIILDPTKLSDARDLSPDKGLWDRAGALWVPGKPPGPQSFTLTYDWASAYSSYLYPRFTLAQAPAPAEPDLPVETREMPVIGYRAWLLEEKFRIGVGRRLKLKSTNMEYNWKPGTNTAKCSLTKHQVPAQRCHCGLYVLASLKEIENHVTIGKNVVVGAVIGWGRVVQHGTEGWRAEHAKILALLDCKFSERQLENTRTIAAAYGLEIKSRSQIQALVREHGDPVQ